MNYYDGTGIIDAISFFTTNNLTSDTIEQLLMALNLYDRIKSVSSRTAMNYVLVYSDTDYILSPEDLFWLEKVSLVYEYTLDNNNSVIILEVDCPEQDYYIYFSALIKIISRVNDNECLYIFKRDYGMAFGCLRDEHSNDENNFCVSIFISGDTYSEVTKEFLYELSEENWNGYSHVIIEYSPNEKLINQTKFDLPQYSESYVYSLKKLGEICGERTDKQIEEYKKSFENTSTNNIVTYREACRLLENVGKNAKSSYELLNIAENTERLNQQMGSVDSNNMNNSSPTEADPSLNMYSEEAFNNAEILLKEILKQDK